MPSSKTRRNAVAIATVVAFHLTSGPVLPSAYAAELRAKFFETCPVSQLPEKTSGQEALFAALGVGLATALIGSLVDTGVTALKKAVNPDAKTIDASFLQQGLYLYIEEEVKEDGVAKIDPNTKKAVTAGKVRLNKYLGCIVVVVGDFDQVQPGWTLPIAVDKGIDKALISATLARQLGVRATPSLYFEAAALLSGDKTAITWQPSTLYVGRFLNSSFFAGTERGLQLTIKLSKPSATAGFYTQEYSFDRVTEGLTKTKEDFTNVLPLGTWGAMPAPSAEAPKVTAKPDGTPFDPFTLTVHLGESPKPYQLAVMFADAVDANKALIKTDLNQALIPSVGAAAQVTGQAATLTAVTTFVTDQQKAEVACDATKLTNVANKVACKIAVDLAKLDLAKADSACRTAIIDSCGNLGSLKIPDAPTIP